MIVFPRQSNADVRILGVDPGERHVGVAWGCRYCDDDGNPIPPGWRVVETEEMTPEVFVRWFWLNFREFDIITAENYRIYANQAAKHVGRQVDTARLLGFMDYSIQMHNWTLELAREAGDQDIRHREIQWDSNMKQSTDAIPALMKHMGVKPVSPKSPDHQRSAEKHLWRTLVKQGLINGFVLAAVK